MGFGTVLQAGGSQVRFSMVSVVFFNAVILLAAIWPGGQLGLLTEMSTKNISWGVKATVHRADKLTTFMCRLSGNLGTSNSWDPQHLPSLYRDCFTYYPDTNEV